MTRYYAGVGARRGVPYRVLERAERIAAELREEGFVLRTGGAVGMDAAWARGAGRDLLVYRPEHVTKPAYDLASRIHPKWMYLSDRAKLLHSRNMMIVLGPRLDDPADRLLCWTPRGEVVGGTATAILCAEMHGVPVTNLYEPDQRSMI